MLPEALLVIDVAAVTYSPAGALFTVGEIKTYPDRVYNEAAGLTLSVWYPTGPRIELEPIGPRHYAKRNRKRSSRRSPSSNPRSPT